MVTNDTAGSTGSSTNHLPAIARRLVLIAAIAYLGLLTFNWVTRTGRFSPDSMNYVNIARNIMTGQGVTQPTLGFNQADWSLNDKPPVPVTVHGPLYPILIALVSQTSLSPARSALLVAAAGFVAIAVLIFLLGAEFYDERTGIAAVGLLLIYYPMRWMTGCAWADPVGIAMALGSLYAMEKRRDGRSRGFTLASGLLAGMAFSTKYAFVPLIPVGVIALFLRKETTAKKLTDIAIYAIGFAIPAGFVAINILRATGSLIPVSNPVRVLMAENVKETFTALLAQYANESLPEWQVGILSAAVLGLLVVLATQRQLRSGLNDIFVSRGRWILTLFAISYVLFLIVLRSRSYFDIDVRTIAPAGVILVLLWTALVIRALRIPATIIAVSAIALLLFETWTQVRAGMTKSPISFEKPIRQSERLTWIASNTSDNDLIIGDDVIDIPFFIHRPFTLSFSPFPYTAHPEYEKIMAYARKHCREYGSVFLVLHRNTATEEQWRYAFGDFIADLVAGDVDRYPGIYPLTVLDNGLVFRVNCRD